MHAIRNYLSLRPYADEAREMDLPAFHAAYLLLALIAAGILSLGFFGVLLCVHLALDVWKYRGNFRMRGLALGEAVLRENVIDLTLFFLALCTAVYLNQSLPHIAALSAGGHTHVILVRGLAILLPKFTILHHSLRVFLNLSRWKTRKNPRLGSRLTMIECTCISALVISAVLLAIAPSMLLLDLPHFAHIVLGQLMFWNL